MFDIGAMEFLLFLAVLILPLFFLVRALKPQADEIANTWKFRTVVFTIIAFVIPLWLITLPLFLYLAYRSYVAGTAASSTGSSAAPSVASASPASKAQEISALHALLSSGALTQEEFDVEKKQLLSSTTNG